MRSFGAMSTSSLAKFTACAPVTVMGAAALIAVAVATAIKLLGTWPRALRAALRAVLRAARFARVRCKVAMDSRVSASSRTRALYLSYPRILWVCRACRACAMPTPPGTNDSVPTFPPSGTPSPVASQCSWTALAELVSIACGKSAGMQTMQSPTLPMDTGTTSPVTVLHHECPGTGTETVRKPSRSLHARKLRVEASTLLRLAYGNLVRPPDTLWCATDIEEFCDADNVVRTPEQDVVGVLSAANTVMRYVLTDTFLEEYGLGAHTRKHLAVILLAVYKTKVEDQWRPGSCMCMEVLERFLSPNDRVDWRNNADALALQLETMWTMEAILITEHPFGRLVYGCVHARFEVALGQLLSARVISSDQAVLGLGFVEFYLNATNQNPKRDLLEELGRSRTTDELGAALAYLVLVALRLHDGVFDSASDLSATTGVWPYNHGALRGAALELVRNAEKVVKTFKREGVYASPETRACAYASPLMITMLKTALSKRACVKSVS